MRFIGLQRALKLAYLKATLKNVTWGKGVMVDRKTSVINKGNLMLGDGVYLRSIARGYHVSMPNPTAILIDVQGAKLSIGANSRIVGSYIHAQKSITIGENCLIGTVNIIDCNGHELYSLNRGKTRDQPEPVVIGNNVWIPTGAVILKGTTIGDNCVVGANSVVRGHFPANSVIMGNPAVVVKTLDPAKMIDPSARQLA